MEQMNMFEMLYDDYKLDKNKPLYVIEDKKKELCMCSNCMERMVKWIVKNARVRGNNERNM